jgi:hypothetical protein
MMAEEWCEMCGKQISHAEKQLYAGQCSLCSLGILDILL